MKTTGFACALAAGVVSACGAGDPDAEIRALLAAAEQAAESRDVGFFGDAIGAAYRDTRGHDRDELVRSIRGYFIANQRIELLSRVDEVVLEGEDAARAVVYAGMLGQRAGAALVDGVEADFYRFELELVHEGGAWRIIGADYRRALGE
jgi:endonuclease YncB( thermonuclease family)